MFFNIYERETARRSETESVTQVCSVLAKICHFLCADWECATENHYSAALAFSDAGTNLRSRDYYVWH